MTHPTDTAENGVSSNNNLYRIGAVCRLTGLSPHVLRVWEKRYGVVEPKRHANQQRHYSERDVHKLTLLRRLVDRGQAIGTLYRLTIDELEDRASRDSETVVPKPLRQRLSTVLVGSGLGFRPDELDDEWFDVVGEYPTVGGFYERYQQSGIDLAVLRMPTLHRGSVPDLEHFIRHARVRHVVLVYGYAARDVVKGLQGLRMTVLPTPLSVSVLEAVVASRFGSPADEAANGGMPSLPPARRFSDAQLGQLEAVSSPVACECPRHLTSLVISLSAFEDYSAECENRNREDARLHRYLHSISAEARFALETALLKVMEMEGISLDD